MRFLTLASFLFLLYGCALFQAEDFLPSDPSLQGVTWKLERLNVNGQLAPPPEGRTYTVVFHSEGQIGGKSGCNGYGGTYKVKSGKKMEIEINLSTYVLCPEDESLENLYQSLLRNTEKYEIDGGKLLLYPDGSQDPALIFVFANDE